MPCSVCGTENEAGRKFCGECGASLALACPSCGTPNPPTVKFCGECGTPVGEATPVSVPAAARAAAASGVEAPTAERRLVEELLGVIEGLRPGELTPYVQAQGARFGARLAAARGETDRVEPGFEAAARQFADLSMPFARAVTLLEHGEWLISKDGSAEAEPMFEQARATFGELRAGPWLERLDRVAPGVTAEVST